MFEIVSAIIINRNRRKELEACVQSIKDQTYKSIQILIVDNNSTDGSKYNIKLPYNMGVTLPTNIGVSSSLGEYILLVDNDAILDKKFVEFALYIMKANPYIGIVQGRVLDSNGNDLEYECYGSDRTPFSSQYMNTFYACGCLIRRSCWEQAGGYNKDYFAYYQEHDLAARALRWSWRIWYEPCCLVEHKMAPNERSDATMLYFLTRNHYLFIWEHLPFWLAVFQSIKWIGWSVIKGRHHPYTILRAYLGVVALIPHAIKNRKPFYDKLFTRPWRKLLRHG